MNSFKITIISISLTLISCASQQIVIQSDIPARIESSGAIVCESTPCKLQKSCTMHGERSYLIAYPIDRSKGYKQRKVTSGDCDVGGENLINVYFDMQSNENTSSLFEEERNNEVRENSAKAELFNNISQSAKKIGSSIAGSSNQVASPPMQDYRNEIPAPVKDRSIVSPESAQGTYQKNTAINCGIKPIPNIGCRIGRCIDGSWEQVCDSTPTITCGMRPMPNVGCRIGRCVDGAWEQVCDSTPTITCGMKPMPNIGCKIGRCVDGRWEQVCD